jgi:hypothetical protein
MCNPSIYLVVTYFPTYLPIYETYLLQNWLQRWNGILTQLKFIYNWVVMGIQWMVCWWVLVHCGQVNRRSGNIDTRYLPSSFWGWGGETSQFDWPIAPKKLNLWRLLKIKGSVLMYKVPPRWPTYIGERRTTFAKAYGINVRCLYEEHVEEHIVNLGSILGTH